MAKSAEVFSLNDRINHAVYGTGTIIQTNARHTTITFDENGTKKFVADIVRLERSNTPAPTKPARAKRAKKTTKKS